jgi:hypothetical protein
MARFQKVFMTADCR